MQTIGIIAEYNPFHNGHLYQIEAIRQRTGASHIVIVMSGDFVQRGTPAWTDKYLRTQMALSCGADMVFELPVTFAVSSAEGFARAGISLLASLGFVDGICFGSECDDLPLLERLAAFLANPPSVFEEAIRTETAAGLSYPAARTHALQGFFPEADKDFPNLFSSPNTILALEYLKAIRQSHSPLTPFLLPRTDIGYHNDIIHAGSHFASATAIRKAGHASGDFLSAISQAVPEQVLSLLEKNTSRYPITENDFSSLLYYRLLTLTEQDMDILDMTAEILHRIRNNLPGFTTFADFISKIKTKQYTYSRISRVLLHCLLHIKNCPVSYPHAENQNTSISLPYVPYARLLGFRREKSSLLRRITGLPVITKPADGLAQIESFYANLNADGTSYISAAKDLYKNDILASNLYRQVQNMLYGGERENEYYLKPIIYISPFSS